MKIVNTQRGVTPKVGKPELLFICSACCLMVFTGFQAHLPKKFGIKLGLFSQKFRAFVNKK